jgi:hypothetical protein
MEDKIERKRIMVVDDEYDLTLFYRMSLEYYGFGLKHIMIQKKHCQVSNQIIMI